MTEYKLHRYVPGEEAARERNRLIVSVATQVVPVFAIMAALAVAVLMLYVPPARYAIDVQLLDCGPPAGYPESEWRPDLSIWLSSDGHDYALNREVVPRERLGTRLREVYSMRVDKVLVVDPRRASGSFQEFITTLDIAQGAGVRVLVLAPDMSRPECVARYGTP